MAEGISEQGVDDGVRKSITDMEAEFQKPQPSSGASRNGRFHLGRVGVSPGNAFDRQIPTHPREPIPSPSTRGPLLETHRTLLKQLEANRPPEKRQATLDLLTSQRAMEAFAELPVGQQVQLLQDAGVDIKRTLVPEFAADSQRQSADAEE